MKKKFETLKAAYKGLATLKGDEYERDAESFILEVIGDGFDLNMIGKLLIGNVEGDIESVYSDAGDVMIHFSSRLMEGDIIFTSLQEESQRVVVDAVWNEVVAKLG